MPDDSFTIVAPEDIRSEKLSFKDMVIRCLDRIHIVASQMAEKNTRSSMAAYEEAIASLHCFLSPYYITTKSYQNETKNIIEELNNERAYKDIERLKKLREWLGLIVKNLSKVGLLPPIDIEYDMSTPEQRRTEEEVEFRRILRRMLREERKQDILDWIESKGIKEKVKTNLPKIEDIIDSVYLSKKNTMQKRTGEEIVKP